MHELITIPFSGLLFILPGLALLVWLLPDLEIDWFGWLSLSAGLSLAIFPLLFLYAKVMGGIQLGPFALWILLGFCAILIIWQLRRRPQILRAMANLPREHSLLLILTAGLVLGVRLVAIRGMSVPSWGDSVQHAVIAQLLTENGGLFDSWLPYAPYNSLTVHFGFHSAVSIFQWATGMDAAQATLWVGQIINALAVMTLYPVALRVARGSRWVGLGTLLIAGLISPMPAFYVNWGRYPQLAGQAILPVAIWLMINAINPRRVGLRASVLAGIAAAGMSLTYYRMPFYLFVFVFVWLSGYVIKTRWQVAKWLTVAAHMVAAGSLTAALLVPWLLRVSGGALAQQVARTTANTPSSNQLLLDYLRWLQITSQYPWWLLSIAAIAGILSIVRRRWSLVAVGLWIIGLALTPAGRLIHLPGATQMQTFAVIIALYIPLAIFSAWLIGETVAWLHRFHRVLGYAAATLIVVAGSVWGIGQQVNVIGPTFVMVDPPDLVAMDWIRANTPEDARFLVNGFLIYNGKSAVGADAGWWIPLLAGRQNTMPPQYALMNEVPINPDYSRDVVDLVAQLEEVSVSSSEGTLLLCQQDISHVYIGQGQGRVGLSAVPLFTPDDMLDKTPFSPLYHSDNVWIFAFDRSTCPPSTGNVN